MLKKLLKQINEIQDKFNYFKEWITRWLWITHIKL